MAVSTTIKACIGLLSSYVLVWSLIFAVPLFGLEEATTNNIIFYLLITEEVLIVLCIVVVGKEFASDMKKKLMQAPNDKR